MDKIQEALALPLCKGIFALLFLLSHATASAAQNSFLNVFELPDPGLNNPEQAAAVMQTVSAPDGSLWLTRAHRREILHVSTNGRIDRFSTGSIQPYALAVSKNHVYFSEYTTDMLDMMDRNLHQLGVIDAHGHLGTKLLPRTVKSVVELAGSANGSVWFSDYAANQIGRISSTGRVTLYPLPHSLKEPGSIQVLAGNKIAFAALTTSLKSSALELSDSGSLTIVKQWNEPSPLTLFLAARSLCYTSRQGDLLNFGCRRGFSGDRFWERSVALNSKLTGTSDGKILISPPQAQRPQRTLQLSLASQQSVERLSLTFSKPIAFFEITSTACNSVWFTSTEFVAVLNLR